MDRVTPFEPLNYEPEAQAPLGRSLVIVALWAAYPSDEVALEGRGVRVFDHSVGQ
jgi:hypothetical protein